MPALEFRELFFAQWYSLPLVITEGLVTGEWESSSQLRASAREFLLIAGGLGDRRRYGTPECIFGIANPTMNRGANKRWAYGADEGLAGLKGLRDGSLSSLGRS